MPMQRGIFGKGKLHVNFSWIAPRDRSGRERRFLTGGGVRFCVVHGFNVEVQGMGEMQKMPFVIDMASLKAE